VAREIVAPGLPVRRAFHRTVFLLFLSEGIQNGMRSFPGLSQTRRFPDKTIPGQTFPGQTFPGQYDSRARRFPDRRFPDKTFPGQDDSRTDVSQTRRFSGTILQSLEERVKRLIASFKRNVAGNKNIMSGVSLRTDY